MDFHLDHKKLSYFFYAIGFLITISLLLAISGNLSIAAAAGNFLFSSFSFPSFYLPFFLFAYGYFIYRNELTGEKILLLSLTVIPFLTLSIMFRVLFSYRGSGITLSLIHSLGRGRSAAVFALLTGFEMFILYFIPRFFSVAGSSEDEVTPGSRQNSDNHPEEEDVFKEYAFRFPEPEDVDFSGNDEPQESIDDIFTSILSGGKGQDSSLPPSRPTVIEPVKEENSPYETLQAPFVENDPA